MKYSTSDSHHHGRTDWEARGLASWLAEVFEAPQIPIQRGSTQQVRQHVREALVAAGWSDEFRIASGYDLTLFGSKGDLAFQLQTGNMSRAPYDLLKLQYLYQTGRINAAGLAVPTKEAAALLNENIANAERVWNEMRLFDRVITVPIFLIAFN